MGKVALLNIACNCFVFSVAFNKNLLVKFENKGAPTNKVGELLRPWHLIIYLVWGIKVYIDRRCKDSGHLAQDFSVLALLTIWAR